MPKIHKIGTALIVQNTEGKILLQLRDGNPQIKYPNTWVLFGGGVEGRERPEDTIRREIAEELDIQLEDITLYKQFNYSDQDEEHLQYIFYTEMDLDISTIVLREGADLNYFDWDEIDKLQLGFNMKEILTDYHKHMKNYSKDKEENSKKVKTILINLPIPFVDDDERQPPGGQVSIATYVRSKGHDIEVCDLAGNSENELLPLIGEADIYGIGTYSATYSLAKRLLYKLKEKYPHALFVAGGPHASALPEQVAEDFDVTLCGEGEYAWNELIEKMECGEKPDKIIYADAIDNLDDLPYPDYEYFCDMSKYTRRINDVPVMCLDSSRGCNFSCKFCNSNVIKRGHWRARSAENVANEIKWHYENGWRAFRFNDDNFLADKKRAYEICSLIKSLKIKWRIFARAESLDYELCKELFEAGCTHVSVGIESLSADMLKRMGKATSIERIKYGLSNANRAGIKTRGFFIVGFPGETDDTIAETVNQIKGLKLDEAAVYPCLAYPGTDLFSRPDHYGITWIESDFSKYIQVGKDKEAGYVIETKDFGANEIRRWRSIVMEALKSEGVSWCDERKEVI